MKRYELRENHIESEGDNGNAGISFDAGWDACEQSYIEKIAELEYKLKIATDLLENMSSSFTDTNNDIYTVLKRLRK